MGQTVKIKQLRYDLLYSRFAGIRVRNILAE